MIFAMKKQKNSVAAGAKKVRSHRSLAGISLLIYLFDKLSDKIYTALVNGFFGNLLTSYDRCSSSFENGFVSSYFSGGSKLRKYLRIIRQYLSKSFETSLILTTLRTKICNMAFIPVKSYGTYLLSFGIYTILAYFAKLIIPIAGDADMDCIFIGIGTCIISIPLILSKGILANAVKNGRILGTIFIEGLGYREETFERESSLKIRHSGISILLGLISGVATFFIHPIYLITLAALGIVASVIFISPEVGILIGLFGVPFFSVFSNPTVILAFTVIVTTVSYLIKILRGKRIFKIELIDVFVFMFLIITLFSGAVSVGGRPSLYSAGLSCLLMFGYFLVANLIRTAKWVKRCVLSIVISGTVTAIIGVLQYALGMAVNDWIDTTYFPNIGGRATSLFENPNYLAAFLVIVFPFALYQVAASRSGKQRVLSIFSCAAIVLCTVFTWSRGAWIAMILSFAIFLLMHSKKAMRYIVAALIAVPFLSFLLPSNIISRFMSIGDMSDSSTAYRVYTWWGSIDMLKDYFWGGIGYGADAFTQLYPIYAYSGIENANHSHNLYIQIALGMGIGGVICFALLLLFFAQKSLAYAKQPHSRDSFLVVAASLVSVTALLAMGMVDYVWYNYRIFFLFWVVMALGVACIRTGKKEMERANSIISPDDCSSCVDL